MTVALFPARARLRGVIDETFAFVNEGIRQHVTDAGKELAATCVLFSGGNDSTVLAHLFRARADFAVHINTSIGIEQTRQFVRDTCAGWNLPLIEQSPPPGNTYEELVVGYGFPGPAMHYKMYQRLKERALRAVRKQLVGNPRKRRVVFLSGIRRDESLRRMNAPEYDREGSIVWIAPLIHWTARDLTEYREACGDVPENEVSSLLHMSGECLCGAFASPGERKEIGFWFPEVENALQRLERLVREAGHAAPRCTWGWGADAKNRPKRVRASGPLCSSCDKRFQIPLFAEAIR